MAGHNTPSDRSCPCLAARGKWMIGILILTMCLGIPEARTFAADPHEEESASSQLLMGGACLLVGVPYTAFKLAFAGVGAIVGGMTYAVSGGNQDAAQKVWDTSMKGTYIITPDHLRGRRPINFVGDSTPSPQLTRR